MAGSTLSCHMPLRSGGRGYCWRKCVLSSSGLVVEVVGEGGGHVPPSGSALSLLDPTFGYRDPPTIMRSSVQTLLVHDPVQEKRESKRGHHCPLCSHARERGCPTMAQCVARGREITSWVREGERQPWRVVEKGRVQMKP